MRTSEASASTPLPYIIIGGGRSPSDVAASGGVQQATESGTLEAGRKWTHPEGVPI